MTKISLIVTSLFGGLIILSSCNNSDTSKATEESKTTFNVEEAKKGVEKSIADFSAALAQRDAKSAANFYTNDAVFMPNVAPIVTGRDSIESALAGFIKAGFTKLNVESTWAAGCGEYFLETEKWTFSNGEITTVGKSLIVWKKENGIWKMYKNMINTDSPRPDPVK